jgi:hypothetical protein
VPDPEPDTEPDLLIGVRRALASRQPLDLLAQVSTLVAAVDPRSRPLVERLRPAAVAAPTADSLAESFLAVDRAETTALLAVMAQIGVGDPDLRHRVEREVGRRPHPLPRWLDELGDAEVVRAVEMSHVLRDGDNVLLVVRLAGGHELTLVVYIDHNMGTLVKDAFVVPEPVAAVVTLMRNRMNDPDTLFRDLEPADARARVTEAVDLAAVSFPPIETDTWPACRPLVEWACRMLPAGGVGYERPDWDDGLLSELADRFFASPEGARLDSVEHRELFESVLWFGMSSGPGDPLRWSPTAVEIFLADWLPRKVLADEAFLALAPDLLRAYIRFCHAERGVPPHLTDETLAAVDEYEPDLLAGLRADPPASAAALLARFALSGPPGEETQVRPVAGVMLERLGRDVGGAGALRQLDDRPLPDEPFAWDGIEPDIHDAVAAVLRLCDGCCDELLDTEYRTACRRLLRRVAVGDPAVFRRRGRADTAAAALCWLVGGANDLFRRMLVKDLMAWFGTSGTPSQRAATLVRAAGIDQDGDRALGSPDLLVSAFRRHLIGLRDRYVRELN